MKKLFTILLFIILGFSLTSCINFKTKEKEGTSDIENFNQIEINNEYKVNLPKYMRKTSTLNDEASLQYQNVFKETYVIVIDEPKEEFVDVFKELDQYNDEYSLVENYRDVQMQLFAESMNIESETTPASMQVNGLDAEMVEIDGKVEGIEDKITYFLTFIEGDEKVYMIMAWTMQNRKDTYRMDFENITKSFALIN
ncbi:hypothetical protein [Flagellimonas sp. CMM7]|uniref:hypothetical protein n=1 Tax=Flagellimonas sp. CMM7 TaxID=2654676 RepID=UPI0013D4D98A|nr:hypothetical protein [Flagellimonas sp. CMM7]UII79160.1 hypothetical protein LV704_16050 [Flagellimonas sp. CMM7]